MSDDPGEERRPQGKHLIGLKNAKLGVVREAYLDLHTGLVAFLVVEPAGLFGGSGKFQPIPWKSVRYDGVADAFLVEKDKDQFKNAPQLRPRPARQRQLRLERSGHAVFRPRGAGRGRRHVPVDSNHTEGVILCTSL